MSGPTDVDLDAFIAESLPEPQLNTMARDLTQPKDPDVAFIVRELRAVMNGQINKLRIMIAVHQGVLIARRLKVAGPQKKLLLSDALYFLVDHSGMSEDDKLASRMLLDLGMGDTIDNLVFMATNKINMTGGASFPFCCFAQVE
jgi:hypothetical protein